MSSKLRLTPEILAYTDILQGYLNESLRSTRFQSAIALKLESLDPDKSLTRSILKKFNRKKKTFNAINYRKQRTERFFRTGKYIRLSDNKLKSVFYTKPLFVARSEEEFELEDFVYPEGTNFSINYRGFYCRRRAKDRLFGPENEPYFITSVISIGEDGENKVKTVLHPFGVPEPFYRDINGGEFKEGPVANCFFGKEQEVSLIVTVMEHDEGDPNALKDEIALIIESILFIVKLAGFDVPEFIKNGLTSLINAIVDSEDDVLDIENRVISAKLLRLLPTLPLRPFQNDGINSGIRHNYKTIHDENGEYFTLFEVEADQEPSRRLDGLDIFRRLFIRRRLRERIA